MESKLCCLVCGKYKEKLNMMKTSAYRLRIARWHASNPPPTSKLEKIYDYSGKDSITSNDIPPLNLFLFSFNFSLKLSKFQTKPKGKKRL